MTTKKQKPKQITLDVWITATTKQRWEWLKDGTELTDESRIFLGWAICFQDHGAIISDEAILSAWKASGWKDSRS